MENKVSWPQILSVFGGAMILSVTIAWTLHATQAGTIEKKIGLMEFGMVADAWDAQTQDISGDLARIESKLDKLIAESN